MTKKSGNSLAFWGFVAVVVIGAFLLIMNSGGGENTPNENGGLNVPEVTDNDWVQGNPEAEIVLIEYSDFQCPACASAKGVIESAVKEFNSHIKFVYRHFPLRTIHANAQLASQASEAAGVQGKFWEMYDELFANQREWSELSGSELEDAFVSYAAEIGLNTEQFKADLYSSEVEDIVDDSYDAANAMNLRGTPTLILDGKIINPSGANSLRDILRDAVNAKNETE